MKKFLENIYSFINRKSKSTLQIDNEIWKRYYGVYTKH